ncbi:NAD(P)-dependent oxidoreductase [Moorella naiadis]|uniref:NAD-dependent epimerase/dehydratase family protein n=1 Tax=Moorella naiadis (nom. illeg.) TaxID=3093670 RepID=UPI003D9C9AF2
MKSNKKQWKVVITGATGFVGSNVARRLVTDGWDVHLIARTESNFSLVQDILKAVTIHQHDGTTENMLDIFERVKPNIVFHLAALFLAQHEPKDIGPMIKSNVLFATQLVEAMIANGVYCLINTGTSWQHFENKEYNPVCLYAATKQAFESILEFYVETTPLKVITLKLFDTYGPNDPRNKLFTLLRNVAKEEKSLPMSPGEQLINLVYIDDVVDAFVLAAERLQKGKVEKHEAYAVSSGTPIRLRDIVDIYSRIIGKDLPIEWGGRPYRNREVMVPWNNGMQLPDWQPKISIEEGIRRMELSND